MTETIGKVTLDYEFYPGEDFYCDGAVEDELLETAINFGEEEFPRIIEEKHNWEFLYHLSSQRENIVDWLPMDKSMKVLEVGSGCGAITGALARKAGQVTCLDLSKKRSQINAWRHRDCDNVTIKIGNFQDIEPSLPTDYDYVLLIGVFEYGQSYIHSENPFAEFYNIVKKHVKEGGRLVIAIENKMGLKYWAGCREDHLGTYFSGLEDYPDGGVVRTFTKKGLEKILKECGETEYQFYYPYPDYKFMTTVYSDQRLPQIGELTNNLRNFDRDRLLLFDEKNVFDMLIREEMFPEFSNSFMVVTGPKPDIAYSRFSNDRLPMFAIRTDIVDTKEGREVRKYPAGKAAENHIRNLKRHEECLNKRFSGSGLLINRCELREDYTGIYACFEYIEGARTLEEILDECLERNDAEGFRNLFHKYLKLVNWNVQEKISDYDMIFANILVKDDQWILIDYEWTFEESVNPREIAFRALHCYLLENGRRDKCGVRDLFGKLGMQGEDISRYSAGEKDFQKAVTGGHVSISDMREKIGHKAIPYQELEARAERRKVQIFEDYGEGYRAENSYYLYDAYVADDRIRFTIPLKHEVKGMRVDPADGPCILKVKEVSINGKKLPVDNTDFVNNNGYCVTEQAGSAIYFSTIDPFLDLHLGGVEREAVEEITVEAEIAVLTGDMYADMETMFARFREEQSTRRRGLWLFR